MFEHLQMSDQVIWKCEPDLLLRNVFIVSGGNIRERNWKAWKCLGPSGARTQEVKDPRTSCRMPSIELLNQVKFKTDVGKYSSNDLHTNL